MKAIDEEILDAYARALTKAAEYQNKFINYIELRSLIKSFVEFNPHLDPKVVDWVGVWDEKLTYSEQIENFRHHYPQFRWTEETITEEEFEYAKRQRLERLKRELEDLDEESLKELAQLISRELLPQATQAEQKKGSVIQTPSPTTTMTTAPPTQRPVTEPKITLRTLAGVPVLLEARAFASAFSIEELCKNNRLLREAQGRIIASTKDFTWPWGDPVKDLLSFYLALAILSQIPDRRVWERWAEAERRRAETFMNAAVNDEVLEVIWRDLLIRASRSGPDEEKKTGFPYRIHITDFQRLVKGIDGAEWRLENRTVWRGWVYVTRGELVRLISEEAKLRILRKLETAPRVQIKMVQKIVEDIKQTLTLT
jgi:DNA primase large subunit